jgi:hypothetical protein
MMDLLSKAELFAESRPRYEDVPIGKRALRIGEMTAAGRDVFISAASEGAPLSEFQARMVVATAINDVGDLVFTADDIANLRRLPPGILNELASTAARLNGIGQQALEDAEKNSEAAPSGDSQSDSPLPTEFP